MMRITTRAITPMVMLWATTATATATATATPQDAAVRALVDRFEAARSGFDPAALAATMAPEYEEISPIGDMDSREQVLGFYAPAAKRAAPTMMSDQLVVRTWADMAVLTARRSFTPSGATSPRAVRVRYVARRSGRGWLLVSAQYTPMPPAMAK